MRVAAYTGGWRDPSARARVRQYVPHLSHAGIEVREYPLPYGAQMPRNKAKILPWIGATVAHRLAALAAGQSADATWVCRQLLPTYVNLAALAKKPIALDVDDAIWMTRGGNRVEELARASSLVVCGNAFLAEKFAGWNSNLAIVPTAVDTDFYRPGDTAAECGVVIGWIGTSGNFPYLGLLQGALRRTFQRFPSSRLLVVADKAPSLPDLPTERVEFVPWSPEAEQASMQRMSLGLMPMEDTEWAKGKCAYKMLCYMASSLPVVVSPFGMNAEVLAEGEIGFGPTNEEQWSEALASLIEDREMRGKMGDRGRRIAEERYSVAVLAKRYSGLFHALAGGGAVPAGSGSSG